MSANPTRYRWIGAMGARRSQGFTLVELLVAVALSLVIMLGLVSIMDTVGVVNRTQNGMARLQENGRFAMQRIARDLRAASMQHCSTFNVAASILPPGGGTYQDKGRSPISHFDASAANYRLGPAGQTANYFISPGYMLYGSECDAGACAPVVNLANRGSDRFSPALPGMGIANGSRARGADVLTLRTLQGEGARITNVTGFVAGDGAPVQIDANAAQLAALGFGGAEDAALVTDCSNAEIARIDVVDSDTIQFAGNFGGDGDDMLSRPDLQGDARVFNLQRDLLTVTYYLRLKTDPNDASRLISSLVRRTKSGVGDTAATQELVEGVERLDFLYGVEDNVGRTSYLTAAEVDALTAAECPPVPWDLAAPQVQPAEAACGWRAVKSVEVLMLLNTVSDVTVSGDEEFRYSFLNTGAANNAGVYENPLVLGTLRNGLAPGRMLRREMRMLVSLRGYNY
ncbi:MAG: PilW family protein [Burkholderiaceae bacterium]|nr:PilW family protein [Burkholderiaceae bacterium]